MSEENRNALPNGFVFEGYRIERELGSGGFGITYLATEVETGRRVAIKEYLPKGLAMRGAGDATVRPIGASEAAGFEWGLARFADEARTLVRLEHPNIVRTHRFFRAHGTAYLVMAYVEGESLGAVVQRAGRLSEAEIREILAPLIDGLKAVHGAGFLHRDIKPDNIFIRAADGAPVLLDFGAAREALGRSVHSLTAIFSHGYAPYEQYGETGGDQGPWTDIYALAATAYRCLAGARPAPAPDRVRAVFSGKPDPMVAAAKAGAGDYAAEFLSAIDAGLQIKEADRPQSLLAFELLLRPGAPVKLEKSGTLVAGAEPVPPPAPQPDRMADPVLPRPSRWRWAAGAAMVLAGMVGVAYAVGLLPGGSETNIEEPAKAAARAQVESGDKERKQQEDDARRAAERKAEEDARKRAREKAAAEKAERERQEAAQRDSERRRPEEEAARKAELERQERAKGEAEEAQRRHEDARKRMEEERTKAEEAERRRAEAAKAERAADERRKAEEAKRKAEAEAAAEAMRPVREFRDCPECPPLVRIPAGVFTMGSPVSEVLRDSDEGPQRLVTVPQPFAIGKHEVTFEEWDACMAARGCAHRPDDRGWGRGRRPVMNVSWTDAREYLTWMSRRTGKTYRLPSEAEWEYAARARTTTPFHTGMTISTDEANYDGSFTYGAGRQGAYRRQTLPVGSLARNAFGLYDMHGNVWEWVQDCWNGNHAGAPATSIAREGGDCDRRVVRGGSWDLNPGLLRSASRNRFSTGLRSGFIGFRVARTY